MLEHPTIVFHLHPVVDHFTIALVTFGIAVEVLAAAVFSFLTGDIEANRLWETIPRVRSKF